MKLIPGENTIVKVTPDKVLTAAEEERKKIYGYWQPAESDSFNVRTGPDYATHKLKAPSELSIYEVVAVEMFQTKRKVTNIGRFFDLSKLTLETRASHADLPIAADGTPKLAILLEDEMKSDSSIASPVSDMFLTPALAPKSPGAADRAKAAFRKLSLGEDEESDSSFSFVSPAATPRAGRAKSVYEGLYLPELVIVNVMSPSYAPSLFGSTTDGEGSSLIFFMRLRAETRKILKTTPVEDLPLTYKLLRRYIDAPSEDPDLRTRFKVIPKCLNYKDAGLGYILNSLMDSYNAKPFLVTEGACGEVFNTKHYFEVDIDGHRFSALARNGFNQLRSYVPKLRSDYGFVIEGRTDDELPECLLGCAGLCHINFSVSKEWPL